MTEKKSEEELQEICRYAKEHFLSTLGAFRGDQAIACEKKAFPEHCLYYDDVCIASDIYSTGHSKKEARTDIEKMHQCPHCQPNPVTEITHA